VRDGERDTARETARATVREAVRGGGLRSQTPRRGLELVELDAVFVWVYSDAKSCGS
jgi:hypothetical protein